MAHVQIQKGVYTKIDSMIVYQDNKLAIEKYYGRFDADTLHRTHSSFKSITGILALIAADQGILELDEPVLPLLAQFADVPSSDPRREEITVNNLLDMTSGLDCDEAPQSAGPSHEEGVDEGPTPLLYSLGINMARTPGSEWHYCSANSFMLAATVSAALERAGKPDIFNFADNFLMAPLGITNYRLTRSASGKYLNGQGNSYFRPLDLARIGLLVLNKGKWDGKQIVSEKSIARLYHAKETVNWPWTDTIANHPLTASHYSAQWYQTEFDVDGIKVPVTHSWGNGGQFIFVAPTINLVAVFTGSNQGSRHIKLQKQPFNIMHKYILPRIVGQRH